MNGAPPTRAAEIRRHRGRWPGPAGKPPRWVLPVLLGVGVLVFALVTGTGLGRAGTGPATTAGVWRAGCGTGCPSTGARPPQPDPAAPTGPPDRVRIPRIGVDSSLAVLGLDRSGQLAAPADYARAGWFGAGTAPGDTGPAVIAGHVDSTTGPAVFYRLHELRTGDRVEVRRGGRWIGFVVVASSRHDKDEFPTAEVYGPTPGPELRLVTCTGPFDDRTRHYRDNLVVYAIADR
ncbi:class F sortase [Micromonospora sp. NBC_01699]|uniref:class F sortase n=1 Tax=Micromonospora sp. NBC_01699 TaxID=2975984 RepID=UPI002E2D3B54|nr:class F sortase [Micromonospora sp. NBC_01699]